MKKKAIEITTNELSAIKYKIRQDPYEAKFLTEEYLSKCPYNSSAKCFLVYILTILNRLELAEEMNEELNQEIETNPYFFNRPEKLENMRRLIKLNKIRILARKRKYQEFLDYIKQNPDLKVNDNLFFPLYQLGYIDSEHANSYLKKQIIDYQEDAFFKHSLKHQATNNHYVYKEKHGLFLSDFPIEKVIKELKNYIPSNQRLCYEMFDDVYIFGYSECGMADGKLVDTFKVISLADDEFHPITMYPCLISDTFPYIDLNYLKQADKPKVKALSQIEKFNRRYHR